MKHRTISQIATCFTCGKQWEGHVNHRARKSGYAHAKKTGHKVSVETTTVVNYF